MPVSGQIILKPGLSYVLKATSAAYCSNSKSIEVQSIDCSSDVKAFTVDHKYTFYPNPFAETITIQSKQYAPITVSIYTMQGKLIWQQETHLHSGVMIDLASYSDGIYLLQIENEFHTIAKRK